MGIKIQNLSDENYCNDGLGSAITGTKTDIGNNYIVIGDFCTGKTHVISGGSNLKNIDINNFTSYQGIQLEEINYDNCGGCTPIVTIENFDGTNKRLHK